MDKKKFVLGECRANEPAHIRLFGGIDCYSAKEFVDEFEWLHKVIQPSKIVVHINSEGGSCIDGMGIFSSIYNCQIPTECIIEGIAASMGSVIWLAGDERFMHDYSLLMIHNPFISHGRVSKDEEQTIEAFKKQLSTIYIKRLGLSEEKVKEIMDGEEGCDGTFFSAEDALKEGVIEESQILKTPKGQLAKIKNAINNLKDPTSIRKAFESADEGKAVVKENNQFSDAKSIINKIDTNLKRMNDNKNISSALAVKAGLAINATEDEVLARVDALVKVEGELTELKKANSEMKVRYKGLETENTNLKSEVEEVKSALSVYKAAEEKAKNDAIEAMVDGAIADGKIKADSKADWVAMAKDNFETVEVTLSSIQAREKISDEIAKDKSNLEDAKNAATPAMKELEEKVNKAVGNMDLIKF